MLPMDPQKVPPDSLAVPCLTAVYTLFMKPLVNYTLFMKPFKCYILPVQTNAAHNMMKFQNCLRTMKLAAFLTCLMPLWLACS